MSATEKKIEEILVDKIIPNPYQPRKSFSQVGLEELSASIKAYGILQPISVRKIGEDRYELIAGERRLKAARLAKLKTIPAIVNNSYTDADSAILAIIENLQREDLNFMEEAEGYSNLIEDHGFTQQNLAEKIGKSQSTIANKLRILRLGMNIKRRLLENGLTERHARALLKLPDESLREEALDEIIKSDLNVKQTEQLIKAIVEDMGKGKETSPVCPAKKIKGFMSYRIYVNTLRQTYEAIREKQNNAHFKQVDRGEYIEIIVKIPKS
ncbi:MAG TPA: ParB/RepB/Spo0J family partition protein [Clostridia bacterium]|nr:ParB/RepB/Spo0J family partition protein [Clostridia bacterium]